MTETTTPSRFPRLALDQMPAEVRALLEPVVARLGYLGDAFAIHAHVPAAVGGFMEFTKAVKAPLSDAFNELLALTVCTALDAQYELIQHERLALKLGLSRGWIAAAEGRPGADAALLSDDERAVQALARKLVATLGQGCESDLVDLAGRIGHEMAVAVFFQTTRFLTIAVMCRAFGLSLPVASVFAEEPAARQRTL